LIDLYILWTPEHLTFMCWVSSVSRVTTGRSRGQILRETGVRHHIYQAVSKAHSASYLFHIVVSFPGGKAAGA